MTHKSEGLNRDIQNIPSGSNRIHILLTCTRNIPRVECMLGQKTSLRKFKSDVISSIFSEYNGMKIEINYKKKAGKITNMWRSNDMLFSNFGATKESKEKSQKTQRQLKI